MHSIEIRSYREHDRPEVVALWNRCFPGDPGRNEPAAVIDRKLRVQRDLFLVGVAHGSVVATVLAGYDGYRGWIYHLATDPDLRRRGIARRLMHAAEARLAAIGCPKVNLQVRATNTEVIAFYERIGYARESRADFGKVLAGRLMSTDRTGTLYIFAGLPGAGKSTLARRLAADIGAAYLRIDTIEQALRDLCDLNVEGEGYRLAYRVAADNVRIGRDAVADSCNPVEFTRREWEACATDAGGRFVNIEIVCSDEDEHRRRIETRRAEVPGLRLPTWQDVLDRGYEPFAAPRVRLDTAGVTPDDSLAELKRRLSEGGST